MLIRINDNVILSPDEIKKAERATFHGKPSLCVRTKSGALYDVTDPDDINRIWAAVHSAAR